MAYLATNIRDGARCLCVCIFMSFALTFCLMVDAVFLSNPLQAQARSPQHQAYCLKLERQLAQSMYNNTHKQDRQKIRTNLRNVERAFHRLKRDADRYRCYNYFLFSKELRRTPRCIRIDKKIRGARRQLSKLNNQLHRKADARQNARYKQDKIISALARNDCGKIYQREARKRDNFTNWFSDGFFGAPRERNYSPQDQFKFATHRTLCVRMCDGYYFPISFATTTNRFATDEQMCQSRCAAPARLFTHPNPGGSTQQMLSIDGVAYESIKHAWRYKKEFVKGCSCKASEYNPTLLQATPKPEEKPEQNTKLDPGPKMKLAKETAHLEKTVDN